MSADTEVRSIRFTGVRSIPQRELRSLLHTKSRASLFGLRNAFGKLPLIPSPTRHEFHPRVLQEDVVRLRNKYVAEGFWGTRVHYVVQPVEKGRLLDIEFVIDEGKPQYIEEVTIAPADDASQLPVPPGHLQNWTGVAKQAAKLEGRRLDAVDILDRRSRIEAWWRERGFAHVSVQALVERDTLRSQARVRFAVAAGPRCRFGAIRVQGNESISDRVVRRELPFQAGDLYSESALVRGRESLQELQIVRAVRLDVVGLAEKDTSVAAPDSRLAVDVTVTEAKPRVISGDFGYVTDAGLSTDARWSHRNFTGGARVFSVSGLAQTGALALSSDPDVLYRGAISIQQPHFLRRSLSALVSPFVEYREDLRERSLEVGSNFTLIYRVHRLLSGSLDYRIASRRIYEFRVGDLVAGRQDLLSFASLLSEGATDSLGTRVGSSLFSLSSTTSMLDQIANPRRGILVRPTLQVTAPTAWASDTYWLADGVAYAFVPLSRHSTFATRLTVGRVFPFGKSIPGAAESSTNAFLQLRDVGFTAGGSNDVRGWGHRMLGPKFPDVRFRDEGDSLIASADGYLPLTGLARATFSVELRTPLPGLGPRLGTHVFLDGGRVWTQDNRFSLGDDPFGQEHFFYATGAGLDLITPIGAIKLSVGYKLNPSLVDLADANELLRAILDGTPTDLVKRRQGRRWQFHFGIGSSF